MKTTTFTLLLLLTCCQRLAAQCPTDIVFSTQGQVDSFTMNYPNCTEIEGSVIISGSGITGLDSLFSLKKIGVQLSINSNNSLTTLDGLDNLDTLGGCLLIENNPVLTTLAALKGIRSIGRCGQSPQLGPNLSIFGNGQLTTLAGLDSIHFSNLGRMSIKSCPLLATCQVQGICLYVQNGGSSSVSDNAPGCNSVPEIEAACMESGVFDRSRAGTLLGTFPNPTSDFLSIQLPETTTTCSVQVFDAQGRLLRRQPLATGQALDVQELAPGMYSLRVVVGERVYVGKFVRQ